MKKIQLVACFTLCIFAAVSSCSADESPAAPAPSAQTTQTPPVAPQKIEIPGINLVQGPATAALGKVAEIKVPEGYAFVGPDSLDKFFALMHNVRGGKEVGVILSPEGWQLYFDYDDVGYVKDDEKKNLDAEKLYKTMEEGQESANEFRKNKGWSELKLRGWETTPHYDEKTHNLKWAFKISSSADQHQSVGINEKIRLLGRGGVMKVTLVGDLEEFKKNEAQADQLLADFHYLPGSTYAEFKSGDKIAKYGLAALVVGGAGVVAAKAGLLGKLGVLFAKGGKAIVLGLVALGAGVVKLWKKIIGKDKVE
ncbi:MAG: DUF2167 domain-containing protein [Nibricoccus sp.]